MSDKGARPPSRDNHYVPEWHQRGFRLNGADTWLLDISPPRLRPDGSPILTKARQRAPKSCFLERDLYVTRFGEQFNDDVETILFGGIDNLGATAVQAFISGDLGTMHHQYKPLLAYLGAQTLRTPKGLDWIRSRYPALCQTELLIELQHLLHMYGSLWAESAHEIVSAKEASVKFLLTDHPVTTFNADLPLDAVPLAYPDDAPVTWNGTQTLFPLDADHLLIMTHVAYAEDPGNIEATAKRTNARYFRQTLIRTDSLIRGRQFDDAEVASINAWLKARAKRYIAAGKPDWLFPERDKPIDPAHLRKLLAPPEKDLWRIGGEVHIGYKDGTFGYRDAFGRTSREHEFVAKPLPSKSFAPKDPCPCGRGDTYGGCCESLPMWQRPPWNVLSVRERNEGFLRAIYGVLELREENAWNRVQRSLTDEQVAQLHRISQGLWPPDTDLTALLPRPGDGRLRAVYMGPSEARTAGKSVISLVPLFDQIYVMDPFLAARNMRPEYSPVVNPARHKQQFLKNVMFWLMLEPLIRAGRVVVFPDPGDISPEFQHAMRQMALERTSKWHPTTEDYIEFRGSAREDLNRSLLQLPDDTLLSLFRRAIPDQPDEIAKQAIDYMRREGAEDPFALLQVLPNAAMLNQTLAIRSVNLEVAIFMAQSLGAVIVTNIGALWEHLHMHTRARSATGLTPSTEEGLPMQGAMNPFDSLDIAKCASASEARAAIRALATAVDSRAALAVFGSRLADLLTDHKLQHQPNAVVDLKVTASAPPGGFESSSAQRLIVGFGRGEPPVDLGLALFFKADWGDPDGEQDD